MNVPGMENINELEDILMDVVRRRMANGSSTSALTPIETKAAEILTDIFRIKADISMCGPLAWPKTMQDDAWAVSGQIHEEKTTEEPADKTENKYDIVKAMEKVLKMTRAGNDVKRLYYRSEDEIVEIDYVNGYVQCVSVECDSGIALIKDILKAF